MVLGYFLDVGHILLLMTFYPYHHFTHNSLNMLIKKCKRGGVKAKAEKVVSNSTEATEALVFTH